MTKGSDRKMAACQGTTTYRLRLPRLVSDGMVIQRDKAVRIWGWATPFDTVTVDFAGFSYKCAAGGDGRWEVMLEPLRAGGPYEMRISAGDGAGGACTEEHVELEDILVGDVWVCSGQSNMQTPLLRLVDLFGKEIEEACCDRIRYFLVPERYDFNREHEDLEGGRWVSPEPSNILDFSALPIFFASIIHKKYGVPVGMINASVGGSPAEAWMSEVSLSGWPYLLNEIEACKDESYAASVIESEQKACAVWFEQLNRLDAGLSDAEKPWYGDVCDTSDWSVMEMPSYWEDQGLKGFCGSIWLKRVIDIPDELAGKPAVLRLGTIVDSDTAYVNGIEVGNVTYRYPPRKYLIPAGVIRAGKNIITIRTVSNAGEGGFVEEKPYRLEIGGHVIDLTGDWRYRIGAKMDRPLPDVTFFSWKPAGLYNGMISPLMKYVIKGILWYQGEANTSAPQEYHGLFTRLITAWREKWELGCLPFLFVQLPNFQKAVNEPGTSSWAELRDAQLRSLSLPETGMAVAIDAGEWNDIHPLDKKTIADRLALVAYKIAYGEDIIASGPIFSDMRREGNRIFIRFKEPTGGLVSKDGKPLRHFSVAGADRRFVWANAQIVNDGVVVWNDDIEEPVAVRYAWADNPEGANLYNRAGLPASPFRTDDWEG